MVTGSGGGRTVWQGRGVAASGVGSSWTRRLFMSQAPMARAIREATRSPGGRSFTTRAGIAAACPAGGRNKRRDRRAQAEDRADLRDTNANGVLGGCILWEAPTLGRPRPASQHAARADVGQPLAEPITRIAPVEAAAGGLHPTIRVVGVSGGFVLHVIGDPFWPVRIRGERRRTAAPPVSPQLSGQRSLAAGSDIVAQNAAQP